MKLLLKGFPRSELERAKEEMDGRMDAAEERRKRKQPLNAGSKWLVNGDNLSHFPQSSHVLLHKTPCFVNFSCVCLLIPLVL